MVGVFTSCHEGATFFNWSDDDIFDVLRDWRNLAFPHDEICCQVYDGKYKRTSSCGGIALKKILFQSSVVCSAVPLAQDVKSSVVAFLRSVYTRIVLSRPSENQDVEFDNKWYKTRTIVI